MFWFRHHRRSIIITLTLFLVAGGVFGFMKTVYGVTRTWDGGGTDGTCGGAGTANNWSCAANWSADTLPTASDIASFDTTSTKSAIINANISVAGVNIATGYTGTITQSGSYTITVGASNYVQADGTFTGGTGDITLNGTFTLSGGTFTSTTGTLSIGSGVSWSATLFTVSGGTFNHNNGTIASFPPHGCGDSTYTFDVATSLTLYNIILNSSYNCSSNNVFTPGAGDTIIVANDFTFSGGILNGTWEAQGNIAIGASANGGAGTLTMTGTGSKTYTYTAGGIGPHLRINNAGLTVSANTGTTDLSVQYFSLLAGAFTAPTGTLSIGSGASSSATLFTLSGGTFNHNNGTVSFSPSPPLCANQTYTVDVATSLTLYNIILNSSYNCSSNNVFTPGAGDTIIAANDFTFSGGILSGTWEVQGNVVIGGGAYGGTGTLTMTGTGSKTYTYTGGIGPHLRINNAGLTVSANGGTTDLTVSHFSLLVGTFNAPSGMLTVGEVTASSNETIFTVAGGTLNHNMGTVSFAPRNSNCGYATFTIDVVTSLTLNNVVVNTYQTQCIYPPSLTTASGDTIIVANDFTQTDGALSGTWEVQGNYTVGAGADGGSAGITFTGPNDQIITSTGSYWPTGTWTINKSSGIATLASNLTLDTSQALNIVSGILSQGASYNLTAGAITVSAGGTLLNKGTGDLTIGGTLTNNGLVRLGTGDCGGTDDILIRSSSNGVQRSWNGTGIFTLYDVDVKDMAGSSAITASTSTNTGNNGANWTFSAGTCPAVPPAIGLPSGKINLQSGKLNLH